MKKTIIASFLVVIMSVFTFAPAFAPKAQAFSAEPTEFCDYAVYLLFNTGNVKNEQAYYEAISWAYDFVRIQGCSI